ncbi:SusC/RagA family TonB-linked outer membrane protein [Flavobacteriaceae bacterium TP-CH-4]|uniref:SusC/RagA family TonB-linked outer membrane protein n=1 Tax=Pelagihabitans pacificus TaxID=2696054 RepID=A0A967AY77_9FLAO|nr:SusC/RagA family TonB-linked outer membrane protein [Pelagihabitans pacificus]NHF58751.1 SusC/RagA family TonB-linked outer membrane protein [Pelagihabitans pacificus]
MKNYISAEALVPRPLKFGVLMKLTICFLVLSLFSTRAYAYSQKTKVTLNLKDASLQQVLDQIEQQTDFKFLYDNTKIDTERKVSVIVENKPVLEVLSILFEGSNTAYVFKGKQIVLKIRPVATIVNDFEGSTFLHNSEAPIQQEISGTVTDTEGMPIPGVSVVEKNTSNGVATDFDGNYRIVPTSSDAILVFSALGYATKEVTIGASSRLDITLEETTENLDEVVVTALGIKKDARKLGYAVSKVESEELTVNRTTNFMNTLTGKVAGVNVSNLGSGPGGSSKVRLRGQSSLGGTNTPLIVVNGVPIDNSNFGTNPRSTGGEPGTSGGGVTSDGGDGFSSINPDDIESMTILKGAAAAALYGSRAKDGVIMITTKTRGEGQGLGITYNLNVTNNTPLDFTDYQYEYGQGEFGVRPTSPNPASGQWSFGERFEPGLTQVLYDGIELPYVPQRDILRDFYRDGVNITNSIAISGGGEKGGFNLSLSNLSSEGITPNNEFERRTVNLGLSYDLSDKVNVTASVNYSNEENTNPPNIGQQDNTIPTTLFALANSMPLDVLRDNAFDENGDEIFYSRFRNRTNPYFILEKQFNNIERDRIFGNVALSYKVLPWLSAQARVGQDFWSRDQEYNGYPTGQVSRPPAPEGFVNGTYTQEVRRFRETNVDVLLTATKEFGDFGIDVNLGGNLMEQRNQLNRVNVTDFVIRDLYTVRNGRVNQPIYQDFTRGVNSVYGAAEFSYQDTYYLNVTGRNDWFSTLSPENRSIFYPSITGSYIFSNTFKPSWLTFGKIRAAYAEVGSDTDVRPFSDQLFFEIQPNLFPGPNGLSPVGRPSSDVLPNPDLRPMRVQEIEVGLDLRLFDNRVRIDLAAYQKTTFDQIINAEISNSSGFRSTLINSGESRNQGIEALLSVNPIQTNDFNWDVTANFAYNKTKVISLLTDEPGERILVGRHIFNGFLFQVVGEEMGQLVGTGYRFDEQGRQIFADDGRPLPSEEDVLFGSALPTHVGGITNTFNYKDFNFSFLIDFRLGGQMISGTNFNAVRHGLHRMTLPGREDGVIGVGVNQAGEPNTVAANSQAYWETIRNFGLVEPVVYDSGFWRLRQITLGYNFQRFIPENSWLKGATLSLVANNVAILKKWVPNIDPESFGFTSDNVVGLEAPGVPTTRDIGFNLNLKL